MFWNIWATCKSTLFFPDKELFKEFEYKSTPKTKKSVLDDYLSETDTSIKNYPYKKSTTASPKRNLPARYKNHVTSDSEVSRINKPYPAAGAPSTTLDMQYGSTNALVSSTGSSSSGTGSTASSETDGSTITDSSDSSTVPPPARRNSGLNRMKSLKV